jgi:hypothetical protein
MIHATNSPLSRPAKTQAFWRLGNFIVALTALFAIALLTVVAVHHLVR